MTDMPQTFPANTLFGRLGIGSGPGEAIPISTIGALANRGVVANGRLSLSSTAAITDSDMASATAVYFVPDGGRSLSIFNGSDWVTNNFSVATLTLTAGNHLASKTYDDWAAIDSGSLVTGSGPDWTVGGGSVFARGTGAGSTEIELFQGLPVNKNAITLKNGSSTYSVAARQATLLGSFRTTAVAGQTEDSAIKRLVSNIYNLAPRTLRKGEATANWNYSTAAYHLANANTANIVEVMFSLAGRMVYMMVSATASNSGSTRRFVFPGIGIDSVTISSSLDPAIGITDTDIRTAHGFYNGYPGIGYHQIAWLEFGGGTDMQTWYGSNTTGLQGWTLN